MGQERVPVSERSRQTLEELSRYGDEPVQTVLDRAVEEYRRRHFLERVHLAFGSLREDTVAWGEMQAEQRAWEGTLTDGLGSDEMWTDEGAPLRVGGGVGVGADDGEGA
jgi:hypothetical protein